MDTENFADKIRLDDGEIVPIDSLKLAERIKSLSEKDGYTDVRIAEVRQHEMPDFVKAVQGKTASPDHSKAAGKQAETPSEPYNQTLAEYQAAAKVGPSDTARRWTVSWQKSDGKPGHAFSDAQTPEAAIRDTHRLNVNNRLYVITGNGMKVPDKADLPPERVLAEYPDLRAEYLPQTPEERLRTAKSRYEMRLADMPAEKQKTRRVLEAGMERLIKGLPEQTQMQARTNFYRNQYANMSEKNEPEKAPGQQELFADR